MTVNATPLWMQGLSTHSANMYRRFLDGISNLKSGIFTSGDFAVTQNGTPNMTVNVAPGMAFVRGTEDATYQGMYWVENQATQNVSISAAHATLNRIDLLVLRIRDNAYSTGPSNDATAFVVTGTPASSPSAPAAPPNSFVLAQITVGAAVTSIVTANIANQRTTTAGQGFASLRGAFRRCASGSRPSTNLQSYQDFIMEDDTGRMYFWNGTFWAPFGHAYQSTASAYTSTTSYASTLVTFTLPPGGWVINAKSEFADTAGGSPSNAFLQIWDATSGVEIDKTEAFAPSNVQRFALSCTATFSNTSSKTIQLRAKDNVGGATRTFNFLKMNATSVSSIT